MVFQEANEPARAAGNELESEKEEDPAHGVNLLAAAAAIEIASKKKARTKNKDPIHVGEKQ